jgi:hypothetical protein
MVVPGSDGVMDGLFDPDPEEIITTIAGNGVAGSLGDDGLATAAQLNSPGGVAATSSGIVYFSDSANSRIRKVKTGIITAAAGSNVGGFSGDGGPATEAQINLPRGLSLDSAENLYITDVGNSRIRRLNLATPVTIDPLEDPLERWVKATLRFPADWDPSDVALDTVTLQAVDPTDGSLRAIDTNGDGLLDQLLKAGLDSDAPVGPARERGPHKRWFRFEREEVASWASCGEDLDLRVEGRFADGRYFSGDTLIPVQSQNCTD